MPTKKLIEVALPLDAINVASAREKSIRHGHPSTLHLWWARRPLAACRAVLFASLIDDPDQEDVPEALLREIDALPAPQLPDWDALSQGEQRRQRLFRFIEELVQWENSNNERVLGTAHRLIHAATDGNPPPVYDPFAGGGSIPLEAQRLGLEAHASDLNPVAVLINKALIEIPPKFANMPPVNPEDRLGARASRAPADEVDAPPAFSGRGWYSRGYIPHFDQPGLVQTITFRLADSMPAEKRAEWEELLRVKDDVARRKQIEQYLDAGYGACSLRDDRIARRVENALHHFDGQRYRLIAWVIMPNHVHVMIETFVGYSLGQVIHSWKSFTAKEANKLLGRSGDFWQPEYFDRFIRDERHFAAAMRYIHENPMKAGLTERPEDWRYSSASPGAHASGAHASGTETHASRMPEASPAGETPALPGAALPGFEKQWRGAQGLAADVRYYGKWMRDEAERRISHLYPKVKLPKEQGGGEATVIAWLWARTVKCPNPACGAQMPLVRSFALSTKKGKETWVEPVIDKIAKTVRFEIRTGVGKPPEPPKLGRGAKFRCVVCGQIADEQHIKSEAKAGRMGAQLMTIVAEGKGSRIYLPPSEEHERIATNANPTWIPDTPMPDNPRWFSPPVYGLTTYADIFTPRQLVALRTFSDLVAELRHSRHYQDSHVLSAAI